MTDTKPTAIELSMARAALAEAGLIAIPGWLMTEIQEVLRKRSATRAEIDAVERALSEVPGYERWAAEQMLAETLSRP